MGHRVEAADGLIRRSRRPSRPGACIWSRSRSTTPENTRVLVQELKASLPAIEPT